LLVCVRSLCITWFFVFYFHFTNLTGRQNHISLIMGAFGDIFESPLAHFFLHLFFIFFLSSFSIFFPFQLLQEASCLCPLFSLPTCYVLGEETTFPSALAFHIHLAQDTIIQLLPWILCLFFPAGFKIPHLYSWNIEHL